MEAKEQTWTCLESDRLLFKAAHAAEQDILFRLHEELFRDQIDRIWGWDGQWQIENFRNEWLAVDTTSVYEAGRLVGCLQTRVEPDHLYVLNLAIYPQDQGRGIGSEIIGRLQRGNTALRLSVFKTNDRALSFYLRNGFRITEETATGFILQWESPPPGGQATAPQAPRPVPPFH